MRKSFLLTFADYAAKALVTLGVVYLLAEYHINSLPGFSLQELFMIAGEALVFCAFILASIDTRPTMIDLLEDSMKSFAKSIDEYRENPVNLESHHKTCKEHDDKYRVRVVGKDEIPEWLKPQKKTTKGIPLSAAHKKKISESLKRKNAEKKAQAARIARTASASAQRKTAKKK